MKMAKHKYLVTFDLHGTFQDYDLIEDIIDEFSYTKVASTTYVINTDYIPTALYNKLKRAITKNDLLLIVKITNTAIGHGLTYESKNWLKKHLSLWRSK